MGHTIYAANGGSGPTLWSYDTKQYGVFATATNEVVVCRFNRATKTLEQSLALSTVGGNPLSLPLDGPDPHESPGLGITPNGIIYVAANNFNSGTLRMVATTSAAPGVDITNTANWTNAASTFANPSPSLTTYFKFSSFAGSLYLLYRIRHNIATGNSPGDERAYRHNGTSWSDLGAVFAGATNTEDAFYRNHIYVEGPTDPHPNRGHLFGAWDHAYGGALDETVDTHSYLYTDDEGTTWRNVAGTALTTPIAYNDTSGQAIATGFSFGDPTTTNLYSNGAAVDTDGYPCGAYANRVTGLDRIIRWNGSTWTLDALGRFPVQRMMLIRYRGDLWTFGRPISPGDDTKAELRRVRSPNGLAHVAGPVGTGWLCYPDPVALHETGAVEMLHVNDDVARVVTFGNHARMRAAA